MNDDSSNSLDRLFKRTSLGIKPGLEVTGALLENLGNPHQSLKCIHVAGTNGKGSVCAMIESVLRASGFKTGLYTSPHLLRFNERFRVNGQPVSNAQLDELTRTVLAAEKGGKAPLIRSATFFEISTAMAFEYFRNEAVDYAVIETGLGGRWDSTNVVQPLLSVITRIAMDHAEYLGDSLTKIAAEKAGIIKKGVPVICGPMPVEAEAVVYQAAAEKHAPILGSEEAVFFQVLETRRTDQLLDIEVGGRGIHRVLLPLAGAFQLENCGIAVAALEDLADLEGIRLEMKKGLEAVKWPGRFQLLSMKPPVLFDGAHNPNGAETLARTLKEIFPAFKTGLVFGCMKDKDAAGVLRALASSTEKAWAVTLPGERAMGAEQIAEIGRAAGMDMAVADGPQPVLDWLHSGKKRLLCFAGSLYLGAELKKFGFQI
jgi:dihydrofolate synthase / folylpolyglutamate synthase